jgi:hypothetical protein
MLAARLAARHRPRAALRAALSREEAATEMMTLMRHIRIVSKAQAPKFRGMRFIRRYPVGFNFCGARQSGRDILLRWIGRSRNLCPSCLQRLGRVAPADAAEQSLQTEHIRAIKREG